MRPDSDGRFLAVGQPFDPALQEHLLSGATDRLTGKKPPVAVSSV